MPLFIGLLVVTFAIAGDLVHEAWSTSRAQRDTAERALREFVRLAARSVSYKAQANVSVGLGALFSSVGTERGSPPFAPAPGADALARAAERVRTCRCAPNFQPSYYFRLDLANADLRTVGDATPDDAEQGWLRDTLLLHALHVRSREWDVALIYHASSHADGRARVVAYAVRDDRERAGIAYGFVSDVGSFGDAAFAPLARERMPTPAFASREVSYDSLVSMSVLAPDGHAVYDVNPRRPELRMTMVPRVGHETYAVGPAPLTTVTLYADTVHLGAQFGGLILNVALSTSTPGDLVAGGLPRSRLLVLLGLLVLMAGLVAVAVLQLRREHELARLRAEFTAGVSHELRTPLAQILLYGETLMLERTRSERERRSAAEVIVREARRLMHLVENALHFSRHERQVARVVTEPVALGALTREILVAFAPLAWAARATLRDEVEDVSVLVDPAAFRQILLNLLDNAVKYGPPGQRVTVRLESLPHAVRLVVEDEGPGVPSADRDRIWAPFVRLTMNGHATAGSGIGLAVVRDLAARHAGRAWVEEGASGGARFVVELPIAAAKEVRHIDGGAPARAAF